MMYNGVRLLSLLGKKRDLIESLSILTIFIVSVSIPYFLFNGYEEQVQVRNITWILFAKEAFEKGYADGLVTIKPEVGTVTLKQGKVMVKLSMTYQRRMPAPEVIELRLNSNLSALHIPYIKKYVNVNDYMRYKPEVVRIREGETAEATLIIEFTEELILTFLYNKSLGSKEIGLIINVDILENHVTEKEYKGIAVEFIPPLKVEL